MALLGLTFQASNLHLDTDSHRRDEKCAKKGLEEMLWKRGNERSPLRGIIMAKWRTGTFELCDKSFVVQSHVHQL